MVRTFLDDFDQKVKNENTVELFLYSFYLKN